MKRPKKDASPAGGYSIVKNIRLAEPDVRNLEALAEKWRCSESAAVRRALQEAVERG